MCVDLLIFFLINVINYKFSEFVIIIIIFFFFTEDWLIVIKFIKSYMYMYPHILDIFYISTQIEYTL